MCTHTHTQWICFGLWRRYEQLKDDYEDPKVIMLVGNKKDKVDENPESRIMSFQEGQALAEQWGAEYIETR